MTRYDKGKHEGLQSVISGVLSTQGLENQVSVEYDRGELDVLCNNIYYEVKFNKTYKGDMKAYNQLKRAIKYHQANYGYLVCKTGVYDILKNGEKIK